MKTGAPPPIWFIIGFPIYFVVLWFGVMGLLSRIGWGPLAQSFRTTSRPSGQRFGGVSVGINNCNYKGCLTAVVATEGLWLNPWFIFCMFHPPLLIPWSAFSPLEEQTVLWVKRAATTISTPDGRQIKMLLAPPALGDAMREQLKGSTGQDGNPSGRGPWSG